MIATLFGTAACAGGTPDAAAPSAQVVPTNAAPEAAPASATVTGSAPAPDEEGWSGEKAAKAPEGAVNPPDAPSAAEPTPADAKAPETRTMDVIRKLVLDNRKAARKCYEDGRKQLKDLKGDVVIHFVLNPEGKVKLAELNQERSSLKAPVVVDCVIAVLRGIQFPKSSRGMETSTNYPFNFTP
jgi:hypothetical protein